MEPDEIRVQGIQKTERLRILAILRDYRAREEAHMKSSEDDRIKTHFKGRVFLLEEVIRKVSKTPKP